MLVYPERGLVLNETASAVLRACDGSRTVDTIARELSAQYGDAPAETVAREILGFLERLQARGLLEQAG
jgi:coenzyme PQQ biosynthesis protein PqqD